MNYYKIKTLSFAIILGVVLYSCKEQQKETKPISKVEKAYEFVEVTADIETEPVDSSGDAADDSCIWIHPTDVMQSTIIATNKHKGLVVYNLDGKEIFNYPIGEVNNVDIRSGFILNGKEVAVVTATNRTQNSITFHIVNTATRALEEISSRLVTSNVNEVYGLGMYKSSKTGKIYTFLCGKDGVIEQWELFENQQKIDAKLVRSLKVDSQPEGMVADDVHGVLYVGEEEKALWRFSAEPDSDNAKVSIVSATDKNMKSDFEGVTIYDSGNGKGYVILSSQGNNSYAVFDRIKNNYLGSFKIKNDSIDGTYDTDGIDATSVSFGTKFPKGFFVAQDGANTQEKDSLNQNFKIVNWEKIASKLKLN